ncbi:MAG: hypothetical protein A3F77_12470 [Betaproteobacteria bacterium RIFCSPLOWO2_12_FULL_67_28]|nr:MAG: hypothetical protein A3F77_12470 [Betaproteobacteria bacterium RIFCSPLOWO2_12_FULL_67_28]
MANTETDMKSLASLLLLCIGLSGCVVVPVDPVPGVYVAPPPIYVQPSVRYYYYRDWRHRR